MTETALAGNGINLLVPKRYLLPGFIALLSALGVNTYVTATQRDEFERAIAGGVDRALLVHRAERHPNAASARDMERVLLILERHDEDLDKLETLVTRLASQQNEFLIELRGISAVMDQSR